MQENLLQVCLLAMSLFLCPRENPGLEELHDTTTMDVQGHEGSPLGEVENLGCDRTHPDVTLPPSDKRADTQEQNPSPKSSAARRDEIQAGHEHAKDPSRSQNSDSGLEVEQGEKTAADLTPVGWNQHEGQQNPPEGESEALSSDKQDSLCSHHYTWTSDREEDQQQNYTWYIWNIFSIISFFRLLRKYLGQVTSQTPLDSRRRPFPLTCTTAEAPLPNSDTLQLLHSTCIQPQIERKVLERALLEGFANDLVKAMSESSVARGSAVIEGYRMVDACDIIVPFRPSDSYTFQYELQSHHTGEDVCAQIKVVEVPEIQSGCPCQSSDASDTVCLLHYETTKPNVDVWGDLCVENSPYLSKHKVTRLFQSSVKEAWERISHKYEFELSVCYLDAPGAHVVRFRSGKKMSFTLTPVVKYNVDSYFFVGPFAPDNQDMVWSLSLANYEDHFLKEITRGLPKRSCHIQTLQIGLFLHKKQFVLSGTGALKGSHFKMALIHLLLTKEPFEWQVDFMAQRLRDLLDFIAKSLEKRSLPHAVVSNPAARKILKLPPELLKARAVNLFHPLVVHDCIYRSTVEHFQELLKNANMLIDDYVAQYRGGTFPMNPHTSQ